MQYALNGIRRKQIGTKLNTRLKSFFELRYFLGKPLHVQYALNVLEGSRLELN